MSLNQKSQVTFINELLVKVGEIEELVGGAGFSFSIREGWFSSSTITSVSDDDKKFYYVADCREKTIELIKFDEFSGTSLPDGLRKSLLSLIEYVLSTLPIPNKKRLKVNFSFDRYLEGKWLVECNKVYLDEEDQVSDVIHYFSAYSGTYQQELESIK